MDRRRLAKLGALWLLLAAGGPARAQDEATGVQVRQAIARGVRYVLREQGADGGWGEAHQPGGVTALATLALLHAGESRDDPHMRAAIKALREVEPSGTYAVSLKLLALAKANPILYRDDVRRLARWLIDAQTDAGMWSYTREGGAWDHSNSQYALLALHEAGEIGLPIPANVWRKAKARVLATQLQDGGWAYRQGGESYGSMTAANVANLFILDQTLEVAVERGYRDGVAPGCGNYRVNRPLANGIGWLARNFSPAENPGRGLSWVYYWLYALERAGILSGQRYLGRNDWYREGARFLVRDQNPDGSWGASRMFGEQNAVVDTAFALLFLAKGHKPLLVQKLQWSADSEWNLDRRDVENLVEYIGDKLGEETAWQTIDFNAPLEQWLAAPLLYMQGHDFPNWNEPQRAKLKAYVEQGGTLLVEACCQREEFRLGFEKFAEQTFPDNPLRELDPGHPIYAAHFELKPWGLYGIDVGCRTSVIFSPRDLSCLWEQRRIPQLSETAFKLGTNIAAFAVGRQALRDRLDVVTLTPTADEPVKPPAGDALRIGQVVYAGDWRPDAHALEHFCEFLAQNGAVTVVSRPQPVRLVEAELATTPLVYLTGHYAFTLAPPEIEALRAYLERGGFLLADACCGRPPFDAAFRALIAETLPGRTLKRLPRDHPIFRGAPGFALARVGYKPAALVGDATLEEPELWGVELGGRLAVVFSPYALGCGMEGHVCHDCRGLIDEDARRLTANIVLYALTH